MTKYIPSDDVDKDQLRSDAGEKTGKVGKVGKVRRASVVFTKAVGRKTGEVVGTLRRSSLLLREWKSSETRAEDSKLRTAAADEVLAPAVDADADPFTRRERARLQTARDFELKPLFGPRADRRCKTAAELDPQSPPLSPKVPLSPKSQRSATRDWDEDEDRHPVVVVKIGESRRAKARRERMERSHKRTKTYG